MLMDLLPVMAGLEIMKSPAAVLSVLAGAALE